MTDPELTSVHVPFHKSCGFRGNRVARLITTIIAFLVISGVAVWIVDTAHKATNHSEVKGQVAQVALSLKHYSDYHGHLPYSVIRERHRGERLANDKLNGPGPPLYSWRVEIIPYLMGWRGMWDPAQAWDAPINKQLLELSSFYAYIGSGRDGYFQSFPDTNLMAVTGPGTAFGEASARPMAPENIPRQTILVVETRASGIPWPAPGDFEVGSMPQTICAADGRGVSGSTTRRFHVIFADAEVWLLSDEVPFETLQKFFRTADAGRHDREQLLGKFVLDRRP